MDKRFWGRILMANDRLETPSNVSDVLDNKVGRIFKDTMEDVDK